MRPTRTLGLVILLLLPLLAHDALAKQVTSAVVPPLAVTGTTSVGRHPEGVAIDPVLGLAVVANRNDHTVSLVDLASGAEVRRVRVGIYPYGVAVNSDTHRAVVTSAAAGTVSIVDLESGAVAATVGVGRRPLAVAIHRERNRAYVANTDSNDVSVVDLATATVVARVRVGRKPSGIAVNPSAGSNGMAAVTSPVDDSITFLDLGATPSVHGVYALRALPEKPWRHQPLGVAYDSATNTLVTANSGSWTVGILRLSAQNAVTDETFVPVGKRPVAAAVVPGTSLALVTSDRHDVYAADLAAGAVVARATVGRDPSGIAVDGALCKAVVTNRVDNTVSLLGVGCQQGLRLLAIDPSVVSAGGPGFVMTLTGTGFVAGSVVTIGSTVLTPLSIAPDTITVTVPASVIAAAATLPVSVQVPSGETTNSLSLTVSDARLPILSSISPSQGIADFTSFVMTLTGANFLPGAQAELDGRLVPETTVVTSKRATVVVPADLVSAGGTFDVAIVNPGGARSNALPFLVLNPEPVLSLIVPNRAAVGSDDVAIGLSGEDFVLTSLVYWCPRDTPNDIIAVAAVCSWLASTPFLPNPAGQINATIPGELLVLPVQDPPLTEYVYEIKVFNPAPGGGFSAFAQPFTVINPTLPPGYAVSVINDPTATARDPERVAILRQGSASAPTAPTYAVVAYADNPGRVDVVEVNRGDGVKRIVGSIALPSKGLGDIDVLFGTNTFVVTSGHNDTIYVVDVNLASPAASVVNQVVTGPGQADFANMRWPFGVAVNPVTRQAIITNLVSQDITVIDLDTLGVVDTITPSGRFQPSFMSFAAVNSTTNVAAVVDQGDFTRAGWVLLVDIAGGRVLEKVTVGPLPSFIAVNPVTNVAAVTHSLITAPQEDAVVVIDMATAQATSLPLQEEPAGIAIDPATNTARVATQRSNQIFLIDLAQRAVVPADTLQLGAGDANAPSDLAWDPLGRVIITTSVTTNNYIVAETP